MGLDIPVDTPETVRTEVIGSRGDVEMVFDLTTEQAEEYLADLDRLLMDRDLSEEQLRLKAICLRKLTEVRAEERNGAGQEREMTIGERHAELREYIQIMRWRHERV